MGYLLTYWLAGCVVMGLAFGAIINKCPAKANDAALFKLVAVVAVWPLYLVAGATIGKGALPKSECA